MNRREFLKGSAAAMALAAMTGHLAAEDSAGATSPKRNIRKGIMWGTVGIKGSVLEKMKVVKEAGFEGVEMNSHMDQDEVVRARDEVGLVIPSVCGALHWDKPLSHPDPKIREEGLEALKQTLRDAKRYGASSVLLVPAVVNKEISYADAYARSQAEIRKAIPLAEELGVKIAIENVWNHFLLSPLEAVRYVDEFNSPAVGWHFDVGNVITYGWPEQWIRALGKRIQKFHIKEYSRKRSEEEGLWKGFDVPLLEGDDDWPTVMKAIDEIRYTGWVMTEQGGGSTPEGLKDLAQRLGKILAC
ncbi:MAG TPA: sugar phosphate isomerase/epimerase family protein [Candidatus Limnocylindrales bacterium]|nr:sugar phosphate isomerase/epimerase family protein [Candidatus Limnocylindrales bacterium]